MTFQATYLGSNGWFIKFKKTNLIIDPWLKGDLIFPPGEWFFKGSLEEEISIDKKIDIVLLTQGLPCLLYTSPSPRDRQKSRMPSSA